MDIPASNNSIRAAGYQHIVFFTVDIDHVQESHTIT